MEISLLRTGGIIPIQKKAKEDVAWGDNELEDLINHIKTGNDAPGIMRDNTQYHLIYKDETIPIDIGKVPPEYKEIFERLKENLQIVKPG